MGGGGTVENCYFAEFRVTALELGGAGSVIFRHNVIEDCSGIGINFAGFQSLVAHDNVIQRTGICCYIGVPSISHLIYNNHFLRYPEAEDGYHGYYVRTFTYYPYGPYYMDFTNNYWGTTDPEEISTWIFDGHDDPNVWIYVEFEPMADGPVPVQQQTWTEVKGLFRD